MNWGLLPPATKAMREKSKLAKGRFTGDASHEFEHVQTKRTGDGDDAHEEEETVRSLNIDESQIHFFIDKAKMVLGKIMTSLH